MIREKVTSTPVIDLTGPEGNAFVLMGYASRWARQLGYEREDQEKLLKDMSSGDYEHLLSVLEEHFGEIVIFER